MITTHDLHEGDVLTLITEDGRGWADNGKMDHLYGANLVYGKDIFDAADYNYGYLKDIGIVVPDETAPHGFWALVIDEDVTHINGQPIQN